MIESAQPGPARVPDESVRGVHRRGRRVRGLPVALIAALASGALAHPPVHEQSPCATDSTPGQVFLGLYSIFYRGNQVAAAVPVAGWPPAPLQQAAEYVRCDPDSLRRKGRIRYAAMKLAAAGVFLKSKRGDPHLIAEFERALAILGVPPVLMKRLSQLKKPPYLPLLESAAGKIIDSDKVPGLDRECCACLELGQCQIGSMPDDTAVAEFKLDVNRDPGCLFHTIDPICWPSVAPLNFKNTFPFSTCKGPRPECRSKQSCDKPLLSAPAPIASPPLPATSWCGLLFEDFGAKANGIDTEFKNVLGVLTEKTPATPPAFTSYRMDYQLCESREWSVWDTSSPAPPTTGICALDRDCGYAFVSGVAGSGAANIYATKRVRFTGVLPNNLGQWAPAALEVMVKETAVSACMPYSECPGAAADATSCPATPKGSTPAGEECTCPAGDSCSFPLVFDAKFPAPYCPPSCAPYCPP
jgi:hypothetical protein